MRRKDTAILVDEIGFLIKGMGNHFTLAVDTENGPEIYSDLPITKSCELMSKGIGRSLEQYHKITRAVK